MTKPKVTLLNLLVGIACFVLAAYPRVDFFELAVFAIIGYMVTGGCGVLNSVYDRDIDKLMLRTSKRPIPAGEVTPKKALFFGLLLTLSSLVFSYFFFNMLTFLMVALGIVFYLLVYTILLKRSSPWNVVIGGFAGCFAALSGWTAAVNTLTLTPFLIAALDFLWTPGHLWCLAIKKVEEYRKVGVPMLPVVVGKVRASQIVFWLNLFTVSFSFSFSVLNLTGMFYLVVAMFVGIGFLAESYRLLISASESQGFKVFLFSMPYLMCLMFALIIDKILFI